MKKQYFYRTDDLRIRFSKEALNSMEYLFVLLVQRKKKWFIFWRWKEQIIARILIKEVGVVVYAGDGPADAPMQASYVQGFDHKRRPVEIWRPEDFNLKDRIEKLWASYHQQEAGRLRTEQLFKKQLRDI